MKFYSSDFHWDHANIINLCKRPFDSVTEMQDVLVANWNYVVSNSDDVYILGDFSFGVKVFIDFMGKLNGTKHFIRGNHDAEAFKKAKALKLSAKGKGSIWNKVFFHEDVYEIKDNNQKITLCHYPIFEWSGYYKGAIHLHGHCHFNIGRSFKDGAYDVGVDGWGFAPVTLEQILSYK